MDFHEKSHYRSGASCLNHGGLPQAYLGTHPAEELRSYVNLYLREEVAAEALTRNIPAFTQFLDTMALANGEELNFIIQELRAYVAYQRLDVPLTYWRSTSQFEVDLVLGEQLAVEIKSTQLVSDKHLKGLRAFKEEKLQQRYVVVSLDPRRRKTVDGLEIWPWREFLTALWAGELLQGQ